MAENKIRETDSSIENFINSVDKEQKRKDSWDLIEIMRETTGHEPRMWGTSMIGFDSYHYKYESGREGDSFITGFAPRKAALAVYIMPGFSQYQDLLEKLGSHKTGKSCLYLKNLDVVDRDVLKALIQRSVNDMREKYPS